MFQINSVPTHGRPQKFFQGEATSTFC